MQNLKIACIIHGLPFGGMERVMSILLNSYVKKEGVEVSLLLIGRYRAIDFAISEEIKVYIPKFEFNAHQRNWSTVKTVRFIRKTIEQIEPDTILSFGEIWNNLVLVSLTGLNYPVYISDRSQPNKNLGRIQNFLRSKLYPKAEGFIAQTEKAKQIAIANKWNRNITVIGNPIKKIAVLPEVEKENIVLTVGRLIKTKHVDELMKIFIACDMPAWKLVIVGGNSKNLNLLEEYQAMVKTEGFEDRIELVGAQKDVEEYYRKSKVFAFTSSSEGFPNVIGEAMSYGLPVISYDCTAGPSDLIVQNETGFLIEERNHEAYIQKLKILLADSDLRRKQGENALQKIREFEADNIADRFFTFITHN